MATLKSIPTRSADVVTHSPDLTVQQYRLILETVACRMVTLGQIIMMAQESDGYRKGVLLTAAESLIDAVGAMSDGVFEGPVHGNAEYWIHGPAFAKAGKEVPHG